MKVKYQYQPEKFFILTFLITWVSWFIGAYFSYQENGESIYILFMLPGLMAPFIVALCMIMASGNAALKKQFVERLVNFKLMRVSSIPFILFLMPLVVIVSILLSTLFGQSLDQLRLSPEFSFSAGMVPVLLVLFLAASFEELGWRSYAMDSLMSRLDYFKATLVFAVLWASWHLPLYLVDGYYQNELLKENLLYAVNFLVSVIPMAFVIGWICQKNNGNIFAAIAFHFVINMSQELFAITQVTKCVETVVLFGVAGVVVLANKDMFFNRGKNGIQQSETADRQQSSAFPAGAGMDQ